jgi:DNA modification methylase
LRYEVRALSSLKLPKRNVRAIDPAHVREVVESIKAFGFVSPMIAAENGTIINGAVRAEAARQLGLKEVPCAIVSHLSASAERRLRLADNRLGEKGGWTFEQLTLEVQELIVLEGELRFTGFSGAETDQLLLIDDGDGCEVGPLEPPADAQAVTRLGDVWVFKRHRVLCGDARQPESYQSVLLGETARLVLTDEPYNVRIRGHVSSGAHREFVVGSGEMSDAEFVAFNVAWMAAASACLTPGGLLATFIDWGGYPAALAGASAAGLRQLNLVVWSKPNPGMGSLYRSAHELLPIWKLGDAPHVNNVKLGKNGRSRANVWTMPGASSFGSEAREGLKSHPTVKPARMLADALLDLTNRGEIACDPFLGSGSTLIAAEQTGRWCRGIELDPLYVDLTVTRFETAFGQEAVLEATGETFAQVAKRRQSERDDGQPPADSAPAAALLVEEFGR